MSDDDYPAAASTDIESDASFTPKRKSIRKAPKRARTMADHSSLGSEESTHPKSLHNIREPAAMRVALLKWYKTVEDNRQMPWRKPYDPKLGPEGRSQRAYEVCRPASLNLSMHATLTRYGCPKLCCNKRKLLQLSLTTTDGWKSVSHFSILYRNSNFIDSRQYLTLYVFLHPPSLLSNYFQANATLDEVNALWKGLGYYSRASRLLQGAQKVVKNYAGILPGKARDLEAHVPGIGRYSAGAVSSIAHGERVAAVRYTRPTAASEC